MKHHETIWELTTKKTETTEVWNTKKHDYMIMEITFHRTYQVISPTSASSAPLQVHLLPMQHWWLLHSWAHHVLLHRLEDTVPFAMDRMSSPQTPWIYAYPVSVSIRRCVVKVKKVFGHRREFQPSDRSWNPKQDALKLRAFYSSLKKEIYLYLSTIWVVHNCRISSKY